MSSAMVENINSMEILTGKRQQKDWLELKPAA